MTEPFEDIVSGNYYTKSAKGYKDLTSLLKPKTEEEIKKQDEIFKKIKNQKTLPVNMDKPLSQVEYNELAKRPDIKEFMKGAYLVDKDGRPAIFYRGARSLLGGQLHKGKNVFGR